ncbi:MAG: exopolyphosphatase [Actinomycetaceae bacterium]|nr:exopolyphosphatase [Actinomycetaceae bacterium]
MTERRERVAAIDCGTNSIRLLIGYREEEKWTDLVRTMTIVRLGEGVNETGILNPDAVDRTVAQSQKYASICENYGVERLRFVATSATRDAANRDEFFSRIHRAVGVRPEVISGTEEAELSFRGATSSLTQIAWPALVVDIGGGSTEFVVGDATAEGVLIDASCSINMGSVRVTEMFPDLNASGARRARAIENASRWVDEKIDEVARTCDLDRVRTLIGVAGTVTTITAHVLGLDAYDSTRIHASRHTFEQMIRSCTFMIEEPTAVKADLAYMPTGRADVIGGGAIVWLRILRRLQTIQPEPSIVVSEHDILDGVAHSLLTVGE